MGRIKPNKPRRPRNGSGVGAVGAAPALSGPLRGSASYGAGAYRETGCTPGMAQQAPDDITVCPACGLDANEIGGTFDGRMTASCDNEHDWDITTGELTEISQPPEHREPPDPEDLN